MLRRIIIVIIILAALTIGAFCLFRPTTTVTNDSQSGSEATVTSLYCQHDGLFDNRLFETEQALSTHHEVEAILYDDQLHDVSYTYTGQYADHAAAATAEAHIHAAVNAKITQLGLDNAGLSVSYSAPEDELIVRVTTTEATLSPTSAPLVLLSDPTEPATTLPQGINAVKTIYTSQGFTCQRQNNN